MPGKKLTHRFVKGLGSPEKQIEYYDKNESGLILRLSKAGSKTFAYRYRFDGKNRRYTIGKFPEISLSDARAEVRRLKVKVNDGIDPQAEKTKRKFKPKELTFRELTDIFTEQYMSTLADKTRDEYSRHISKELLNKHHWGEIPVSEFTSQHVREVLNHKAFEEGFFTAANRLRSTISTIFSFGLKNVGINLDKNPAENTPVFDRGENVRERIYSDSEIRELWDFWETKSEPIQSYYKLLLLTGQRRTETIKMEWSEINWNAPCKRIKIGDDGKPKQEAFWADMWTIPKEKAKNNQENAVPLSGMVKSILEKLKPITGESKWVFESPRKKGQPLDNVEGTTNKIKKTIIPDFRIHDLRRTMATKLEEILVDGMVIKKILNHTIKGVTGKHYQWYDYADKKLEALNRWALRVDSITSETKNTN